MGAHAKPGDWICNSCGSHCFASKSSCFRCGEPRPAQSGGAQGDETANGAGEGASHPSPATSKPRRLGDWDCPRCAAVVFASKSRCFRCAAPRPAHLEAAPWPRQPQRRPGDWDCPNPDCRALVFASKSVCYRCGSAPTMMYGGMAMAHQYGGMYPQQMQKNMELVILI